MTLLPVAQLPLLSLRLGASVLIGAAVGVLVWWVIYSLRSTDLPQVGEWRYDISRINELRRADAFFRLFQPAVQLLAELNRRMFRDAMPTIHREIQLSGLPRFWLPEEYLAKLQLLALFLLPFYAYVLVSMSGPWGLFMALLAVVMTAWFLRYRLRARAAARLRDIKRRMPFLLDLLTLLMEAGATFINALAQAVQEFADHPVGQEFGRVLSDIRMGKTRHEAFLAMRDRLADDEITSILAAILQGEHLGTPLAQIFRTQADVLRVKRSQRAEALAGEAAVKMLLPGLLVMVATVIIILGPFILVFFKAGFGL